MDAKLKPWLIEVNISPSLHSSSPLDLDVKAPLATEVYNLVRYHVPPAKMSAKSQREILDKFNLSEMTSSLCMDKRLYSRELSKAERSKQDKFNVNKSRDEYLESIIANLTPDDVRCLIRAEDELVHATHFSRIFPTQVRIVEIHIKFNVISKWLLGYLSKKNLKRQFLNRWKI